MSLLLVDHAMDQIVTALQGARFDCTDEYRMQDGVAQALAAAGLEAEREAVLSRAERIDFLVAGVGIECKVDGSAAAVARQVVGYLQHPQVSALLLITARARLGRSLPPSITVGGTIKLVRVVETWQGSL